MRECDCVERNVTVTPFKWAGGGMGVQVDSVCPVCRGIFSEWHRDKAAVACIEYIEAHPDRDTVIMEFV